MTDMKITLGDEPVDNICGVFAIQKHGNTARMQRLEAVAKGVVGGLFILVGIGFIWLAVVFVWPWWVQKFWRNR